MMHYSRISSWNWILSLEFKPFFLYLNPTLISSWMYLLPLQKIIYQKPEWEMIGIILMETGYPWREHGFFKKKVRDIYLRVSGSDDHLAVIGLAAAVLVLCFPPSENIWSYYKSLKWKEKLIWNEDIKDCFQNNYWPVFIFFGSGKSNRSSRFRITNFMIIFRHFTLGFLMPWVLPSQFLCVTAEFFISGFLCFLPTEAENRNLRCSDPPGNLHSCHFSFLHLQTLSSGLRLFRWCNPSYKLANLRKKHNISFLLLILYSGRNQTKRLFSNITEWIIISIVIVLFIIFSLAKPRVSPCHRFSSL